MSEEPLWNNEVKVVFGARHCYLKQAPLFLQLRRGAGTQVRRHAAVDNIEDEDRFPFLSFGGMDCR